MKLQLDFEILTSDWKIEPTDKILSVGSCFADEVGNRLQQDRFDILCNPFGVIFHPLALANILTKCLYENFETDIVSQDNDVYFSWNASSTIFGYSPEELNERFQQQMILTRKRLLDANVLIITFGTAIGFRHKGSGKIVANCHKMPSSTFDKEMTPIVEMSEIWKKLIEQIKQSNPQLKIIFTVSPTKHLRSGIVENVQSKARLIEFVHQLDGNYFPSFELVQEILRDYRFYKADGSHPNELAIDEVYFRFRQTYFSDNAKEFQVDISKYNQLKSHKTLFPESQKAKLYAEKIQQMGKKMREKYKFLPQSF